MNVIIYVCDALRADHVGCYGYSRDTTPHIDRLAEDSVVFENCFAPATWTRPVAASILTGLYPPVHKARQRDNVLNPSLPRLSGILQQAGWHAVAFSAMSNVSKATGFDVGFNEFFDLYLDSELIDRRGSTDAAGEDFRMAENAASISLPWAEDIVGRFRQWHQRWEDNQSKPFFSLLWTIDTHVPYDSPDEFQIFGDATYQGAVNGTREGLAQVRSEADKRHFIDLYDNQIRYSDHHIGVLVEFLKQKQLYRDTLLIVLGDHGEAFWEHGQFGHGLLPFDEVLRVPLIVKLPREESAGSVVDPIVNLTDLFATVLACADVGEEHGNKGAQSRNLLPLVRKETAAVHDAVFSETQPTQLHLMQLSARTTDWKYIETRSGGGEERLRAGEFWHQLIRLGRWRRLLLTPLQTWRRWYSPTRERLYELSSDAGEQVNVYRNRSDVVHTMQALLREWELDCEQEARDVATESITSELDAETWQQLKALGYVD